MTQIKDSRARIEIYVSLKSLNSQYYIVFYVFCWSYKNIFDPKCSSSRAAVPKLFSTRDQYHRRQFFHGREVGVGGLGAEWDMAQAVMRVVGAADEALLACLLLTSCCAAQFLTGHRPVPVRCPGVGDPCSRVNNNQQISIVFCCN